MNIRIQVLCTASGDSLYINDYRIAGPKAAPGPCNIPFTWDINPKALLKSLAEATCDIPRTR